VNKSCYLFANVGVVVAVPMFCILMLHCLWIGIISLINGFYSFFCDAVFVYFLQRTAVLALQALY